MSETVDNRVVQLRFENKDFERKAEQSISTLERLKKTLRFGKDVTTSAFDEIAYSAEKANKNFSLDNVEKGLKNIPIVGEIATGALRKVGEEVYSLSKKILDAFVFEPPTKGFQKYEQKTEAVQTIMISTGKSIEEVNKVLEDLNWYTDQTSYNFTDMAGTIGKFTGAGVKLEDAEIAMEGIANWAASAGVNSRNAQRAFYNLAQAMSIGAVKAQDWKSIEMLNMSTKAFQETAIDTAIELGKLDKVADHVGKTSKGTTISVKGFRDTLKEGWLDNKVFVETMRKYADRSTEFGLKMFKAAQVARTFTDAIEAVKESAQTGWSKSFEIVFGNFEEAAHLWTTLADSLISVVDASASARNALLQNWKDLGGRTEMVHAFGYAIEGALRIINIFKEAWNSVFNPVTGRTLADLTTKFSNFLKKLRPSEKVLLNLYRVGRAVAQVIKLAIDVLKRLYPVWLKLINPLITVASKTLDLIGYGAKIIDIFVNWIEKTGLLDLAFSKLNGAADKLLNKIGELLKGFVDFIKSLSKSKVLKTIVVGVLTAIATAAYVLYKAIISIIWVVARLVEKVKTINLSFILNGVQKIGDGLKALGSRLLKAKDSIVDFFKSISVKLPTFKSFRDILSSFTDKLRTAKNAFLDFARSRFNFSGFSSLSTILDPLKSIGSSIFSKIGTVIGVVAKAIGGVFTSLSSIKNNGVSGIFTFIGDGVNALVEYLSKAKDTVIDFFTNIASRLPHFESFGDIISAITAKLTGARNVLSEFLRIVRSAFDTIISKARTFRRTTLGEYATLVLNAFSSLGKYFKIAREGIEGFFNVITSKISSFGGLGGVLQTVIGLFVKLKETISGIFNSGSLLEGVSAALLVPIKAVAAAIEAVRSRLHGTKGDLSVGVTRSGGIGGEEVSYFEQLLSWIEKAKNAIGTFATFAQEKLKKVNLGKLLVLLLGLKFVGLISSLEKLNGALSTFIYTLNDHAKDLTGGFNTMTSSITNFFDTLRQRAKGHKTTIMEVAISIAILAGALALVSKIPVDDMKKGGIALGVLAVGLVAVAAATKGLSSVGGWTTILSISAMMLALAYATGKIAESVNKIIDLRFDQCLDAFAILVTIAGGLSIFSALLGRYMKGTLGAALTMGIFARSIDILVAALINILANSAILKSTEALEILLTSLLAVSVFMAAAGQMHFGSSAGILAVVLSIFLLKKAIESIQGAEISFKDILNDLDQYMIIVGALFGLLALLAFVTKGDRANNALKAGLAVVAMVGALKLIAMSIEDLKTAVKGTDYSNALSALWNITLMIGVLMASTYLAGQHAIKAAAAVILLLIPIRLIIGMLDLIKGFDINELGSMFTVLGMITAAIAALIAVTAFTKNAKFMPLVGLTAMLTSLLLCVGLLASLDDPGGVLAAAISIAGVLVALGIAFAAIEAFTEKANTAAIALLFGTIFSVIAGLTLLSIATDPSDSLIAMISIAGVLMTLAGVFKALTTATTSLSLAPVLAMIVMLTAIGAELVILSAIDFNSLLESALALVLVLGALVIAVNLLNGAAVGATAFIGFAAGLLIISAAFAVFVASAWAFVALVAVVAQSVEQNLGEIGPVLSNVGASIIASMGSIFKGCIAALKTWLIALVKGLVDGMKAFVDMIKTKGEEAWEAFKGAIASLGEKVKAKFKEVFSVEGLKKIGADIWDNIVGAITGETANGLEPVYNSAEELGGVYIDGFEDGLGTHSWSTYVVDHIKNDVIGAITGTTSGGLGAVFSSGAGLGGNFIQGIVGKLMAGKGAVAGLISEIMAMFGGLKAAPAIDSLNYLSASGKERLKSGMPSLSDLKDLEKKQRAGLLITGTAEGKAAASLEQRELKAISSATDKANGSVFDFISGILDLDNIMGDFTKDTEEATEAEDDFGGGGGGGGGGGAAGATKEVKKLFDVMKDGGKIVQKSAENFTDTYEALGYTHPLDAGRDAVQKLAETVYIASLKGVDASEIAAKTTEDKLSEMREAFLNFTETIRSGIEGQVDMWGKLTQKEAISAKDWAKNLRSQEQQVIEWGVNLKKLAKRIYSEAFLQEITKLGPEMGKQIEELLIADDATLDEIQKHYDGLGTLVENASNDALGVLATHLLEGEKKIEESTESTEETVSKSAEDVTWVISEAGTETSKVITDTANTVQNANEQMIDSSEKMANFTDQALTKAKLGYADLKKSVKEAIESQMDIFSKFDTDSELTGDELLENMESQVDGIRNWSGGMTQLLERGLDEGLYKKLAEMGPKSYEYVQAFLEMSSEELSRASSLFKESLSLPDEVATQLGTDFAVAGLMVSQGFQSGIDQTAGTAEVRQMALNAVAEFRKNLDINSPSGVFKGFGQNIDEGLMLGIESSQSQPVGAIIKLANEILVRFKGSLQESEFETVGQNIVRGLARGIESSSYIAQQAASKVMRDAIEAAEAAAGIASPSKEFARLGMYSDLGLAKGFYDYSNSVDAASAYVGNRAIDSMRAVVGHIADIINGEVQVDPTIRPVMDLSDVESGASAISSMFGGRSYNLSRGVSVQSRSDSVNDMINQMMASQMSAPVAAGGPINMYVYAAPGQSEEEIANIVEQKLMFRINRQGGVWK